MKVRGIKRTPFYGNVYVHCSDWNKPLLIPEDELKKDYGDRTVKAIDFDGWHFIVELEPIETVTENNL